MNKQIERMRIRVKQESKWIADCRANKESSYYGENGAAVQEADVAVLKRWEAELARLEAAEILFKQQMTKYSD